MARPLIVWLRFTDPSPCAFESSVWKCCQTDWDESGTFCVSSPKFTPKLSGVRFAVCQCQSYSCFHCRTQLDGLGNASRAFSVKKKVSVLRVNTWTFIMFHCFVLRVCVGVKATENQPLLRLFKAIFVLQDFRGHCRQAHTFFRWSRVFKIACIQTLDFGWGWGAGVAEGSFLSERWSLHCRAATLNCDVPPFFSARYLFEMMAERFDFWFVIKGGGVRINTVQMERRMLWGRWIKRGQGQTPTHTVYTLQHSIAKWMKAFHPSVSACLQSTLLLGCCDDLFHFHAVLTCCISRVVLQFSWFISNSKMSGYFSLDDTGGYHEVNEEWVFSPHFLTVKLSVAGFLRCFWCTYSKWTRFWLEEMKLNV